MISTKDYIIPLVLGAASVLGFGLYTKYLRDQIRALEQKQHRDPEPEEHLDGGVTKTSLTPSELEDIKKKAYDLGFASALKNAGGKGTEPQSVSGVGKTTPGNKVSIHEPPKTPDHGISDTPSTLHCPPTRPFIGPLSKDLEEKIDITTSIPIGNMKCSEDSSGTTLEANINPRSYKCSVMATSKTHCSIDTYVKLDISSGNKTYSLVPDSSFNFTVDNPVSPVYTFKYNPRLKMGFYTGTSVPDISWKFAPSLGLGLFSYGSDINIPEWQFITVGTAYDLKSERLSFLISPVSYKIRDPFELLRSTYISPALTYESSGINILLGIEASL